jgi:hypothetical protein
MDVLGQCVVVKGIRPLRCCNYNVVVVTVCARTAVCFREWLVLRRDRGVGKDL